MSATHHRSDIVNAAENTGGQDWLRGEYSTLYARAEADGEVRTFLLQAALSEDFGNGLNGLLPVIEKKDIDRGESEPRNGRPLGRLEVLGVKLDLAQEWTEASSVVALRKVVKSESGAISSDSAILRIQPRVEQPLD